MHIIASYQDVLFPKSDIVGHFERNSGEARIFVAVTEETDESRCEENDQADNEGEVDGAWLIPGSDPG